MYSKIIYGFFFLLVIFSNSEKSLDQVGDIIKRKIEKSATEPIVISGVEIQCARTLSQFYLNRSFASVWNNPAFNQSFMDELLKADAEGLSSDDYHLKSIRDVIGSNDNSFESKANLDLLMTDAFLLYVSHLFNGKINPEAVDSSWHIIQKEGNPVDVLEQAIKNNNIHSAIERAKPLQSTYSGLRQALLKYRKIQQQGGWGIVADGKTLKLGMSDSRISLIRRRLLATQEFADDSSLNSTVYDEKLFLVIMQFQARHGLDEDGYIGKQTIAAMNVPVGERILEIMINMERLRWLPQDFEPYYLMVNIPNFRFEVVRNGKKERSHKIIIGRPERKTPVFSSKMTQLIFNPNWTVPPTILKKDVLPEARKDLNYLKKVKLKIYDQQGNEVDPTTVNIDSSKERRYRFRQAPGPDNALGAVKFVFPNNYNVYLHDTPYKELFGKSVRAFSSGCIRTQNALDLAEYVLNNPLVWNKSQIDSIVLSRKTRMVLLKEQPVVYVLYLTAWVDENGIVQFRNDIYNRDPLLMDAILNSSRVNKLMYCK